MNRALFVTDNLFQLGTARGFVSRALDRIADGMEVHLAAPRNQQDRKWLGQLPITLHDFTAQANRPHFLAGDSASAGFEFNRGSLQAVFGLRQLIRELGPDKVEACGNQAASWALLAALGQTRRRQQQVELIYHEFCMPPRPRRALQWLQRLGGLRFAKAYVPHQLIQDALVRQHFKSPIEIAPVGLRGVGQTTLFQIADSVTARNRLRARLGLAESTWIAGAVAPLIPRSRLKDLIWATDLLSVVRDDFHFVIFGTGSQYARLKMFADLTEASDHVHFLGEPEDAWTLFQGLDVFWQSHLQEPIPQNMLGAMKVGIPVVSVLGAGTAEVIRHQQTGFGVNFGARDEFARWTKYLIEQAASAKMIRDQGKDYVENRLRL